MITGDGVFRSDDAGKTWHAAGLADTHTISAIVVDPHDPDVVYASSMGHVFKSNPERGVFKSTDGGKTWSKILYVDDKTGAIDLVMDPRDPQVLYAAMWQAYRTPWKLDDGGPGSGLYKSTDGGAHWHGDLSQLRASPQGVLGRIGVSRGRAATRNVVYAIVQAKHGGVFRSERRRRELEAGERQLEPAPARLLLHEHLRRPEGRQHGVRAEGRCAVGLARRRQELRQAPHAARRQPHRLDQP